MNPDDKKKGLKLKFQEEADPRSLDWLGKIYDRLDFVLGAARAIRIDLPKIFPIQGTVSVDKLPPQPPIKVANLSDLREYFVALNQSVTSLQQTVIKLSQGIPTPKEVVFPSEFRVTDWSELLDGIEELKKGFNLLLKKDLGGSAEGPIQVEVIKEPIRMVPQPVTHMSINGLQGFAKSTNLTVATTATALPATPLTDRRTFLLYNSSANTIYLGGDDVNTTNGLPILATSFSPAIDASANMLVYAIADSASEVRVFEVSDEQSGR